jgi:hypothetical protein
LIREARAAREEAERVRETSFELRVAVRRANRVAHARTEKAVAAGEVRRRKRRAMTVPSPWSALPWLRQEDEVDRTLVSLD